MSNIYAYGGSRRSKGSSGIDRVSKVGRGSSSGVPFEKDSRKWDAKRLKIEKERVNSYGYNAFKKGIVRAPVNDKRFNNYLNDIRDNNDTISASDAIKGVKSIKHQLMKEWLSGWDKGNIEALMR